jgi:DNA-binding transcriptional LysR family regulator
MCMEIAPNISTMNLRRIDLNLLVIFDALMTERHVTRAAERVGLSQPAFSNALSRLRRHFDDDLFVRGPDGMRPTARALELADQVHAALGAIDAALDPARFDPATAQKRFTIETNDYAVSVIIPRLIGLLRETAPGIDIRITPQAGRTLDRLDAQDIDMAIGAFGDVADRFGHIRLMQDDYVVLMCASHPLAGAKLSAQAYAAAQHVLVSPRGDPRGFADDALAAKGLTRRIVMTVNQFSVVPPLLAGQDLIATIPRRIADLYAARFGLAVADLPIRSPNSFATVQVIWHKRLGEHPANRWFRETLAALV